MQFALHDIWKSISKFHFNTYSTRNEKHLALISSLTRRVCDKKALKEGNRVRPFITLGKST